MRRSVVTTTFTLALALAPAAAFAQAAQPPATGQPPAGQTPAGGQAPAAAAPAAQAPRLALTGSAVLMYQIKPDQTAAFEELLGKAKAAMTKSENPLRKQQLTGWKVYKAAEPFGQNALYVCVIDPAVPAAEYDFIMLAAEGRTAEEAASPDSAAMFKKYAEAFAGGANKLSLTPVASFSGGM